MTCHALEARRPNGRVTSDGEVFMMTTSRFCLTAAAAALTCLGVATEALAQPYPNPYRMVEGWAKLPEGRKNGAVGGVTIGNQGKHVWAVIRCDAGAEKFGLECLESDLDVVVKFSLETGETVESFGGGMFIWPHGIDVDPDGNVWVTDAAAPARVPKGGERGHRVIKFSPTGKVLMTLGTPGVPGNDEKHFSSPADVVVADDGSVFVGDGHNADGNNRIVKFDSKGKFIKQWGKSGYGPGEFHVLHALALDKRGRLFVADRENNRIQLFDQEGKHLATWTQFGRPSGIFFDDHDNIYVADSESDDVQNPGWEMGLRIGDAHMGWIKYFVRFPWGDPRSMRGSGAEFVAADNDGNLYAGEPFRRLLQKYVPVMPR